MVLFAAREIGRPVRWIGDRTDLFPVPTVRAATTSRVPNWRSMPTPNFSLFAYELLSIWAPYLSNYGAAIPTGEYGSLLAGVYMLPTAHVEVRGVFTNTVQTDAYRGAGRPEAIYVVERLVDAAARQLEIDPVAIRKRNFIPSASLPYTTPMGLTYDSGDFAHTLDEALIRADHHGLEKRREQSQLAGRLRGFGVAYYIESCGAGATETADIRLNREGKATVLIGTQSNGQGHENSLRANCCRPGLGLGIEDITVVQGDSDRIKKWNRDEWIALDADRRCVLRTSGNGHHREGENTLPQPNSKQQPAISSSRTVFFAISGTDRSVVLRHVANAALDANTTAENGASGPCSHWSIRHLSQYLLQWLPHLRNRNRSGNRHSNDQALYDRRRPGNGHQPHAAHRPGSGRYDSRNRPSAS